MTKFRRTIPIAIVPLALSLAATGEARAETVTASDPEQGCSYAAALDVRRATFSYRKNAFLVRLKMGDLSKKRTQVLGRYIVGSPDDTKLDVMLISKHVDGERKTFGRLTDYANEEYDNHFTKGVNAKWDWNANTVTFTLTNHLQGKKATGAAYSVPKGAQHGDPCGDYIVVRGIRRG